jgi:beta-ureidopropionase / N-carbamoyl-L-amino-acid hydrolase
MTDARCVLQVLSRTNTAIVMAMETETKPVSEHPAALGERIMAMADRLARWSETPDGLTCTYLTAAHRSVAAELCRLMQQAGLAAEIDAVGNVVGRYAAVKPEERAIIVASHYDTVRNAGKYDGRLGVLVALVVAEELQRQRRKLPFHLDVVAFAEEEGVRFSSSFLGSSAMAGRFDPAMLERRDANGRTLSEVMREAGLQPERIPSLARRADQLAGYLEVHIEQGPVLLREELPVGIVSAIAGSVRFKVAITGTAGHAGTVPMGQRHDAAAAAAELVLYVEKRCAREPTLVGTVGELTVPGGAINIIPGRCEMSLDIRAAVDDIRDAATRDIMAEIGRIGQRRGVAIESWEVQRTAAVRCSERLKLLLADAIARAGISPRELASGAGHDAMMFDGITDLAMLFVRCGNGGVSHSPREIVAAEDADVAARVLLDTLIHIAEAA